MPNYVFSVFWGMFLFFIIVSSIAQYLTKKTKDNTRKDVNKIIHFEQTKREEMTHQQTASNQASEYTYCKHCGFKNPNKNSNCSCCGAKLKH